MNLPSRTDYDEAVQNPRESFVDPDLQSAVVAFDEIGVPDGRAGGFSTTYPFLVNGDRRFAVKCFIQHVPGLDLRTAKLAETIRTINSRYFANVQYLANGIKVRGNVFPLIKMDWVNGDSLGNYLSLHNRQADKLSVIQKQLRDMERYLRRVNIAHGDLQLENIFVQADGLKLVDYDGMYAPGMQLGAAWQIGHRNFQHPDAQMLKFGPNMDRFSAIILDLGLSAISVRPEFYDKYDLGQGLLFTVNDFADPHASPLFQELRGVNTLRPFAERLSEICLGPSDEIPTLDAFLSGQMAVEPKLRLLPRKALSDRYISHYPVVDASNYEAAKEFTFKRVELVGIVERVDHRPDKSQVILWFGYRGSRKRVTVCIFGRGYRPLKAAGRLPGADWKGRWVSAIGEIKLRIPSFNDRQRQASIIITEPDSIRLLPEQEAKRRLHEAGGARQDGNRRRSFPQMLSPRGANKHRSQNAGPVETEAADRKRPDDVDWW